MLHVFVAALKVTPGGRSGLEMFESPWVGRVSATLRFEASDGPEFETTIVYVSGAPATTEVTPSVFVMARPACGLSVSVSVALAVGASEAEAVAVFDRVPVAAEETRAVTV